MVDTPSERFWVWYASQGPGGLPRRPTVAVLSARCQVALVGIVVTGTAALGVPSKSACSAWARSHLSLPGASPAGTGRFIDHLTELIARLNTDASASGGRPPATASDETRTKRPHRPTSIRSS